MLSLGIDASLALRTAFSSAALPLGSPPPSRAATMIARVSFENCAPRRESTTAFLCLMLAHLECPDIAGSLRILARSYAPRGRAGEAPAPIRPARRGDHFAPAAQHRIEVACASST